MTVLQHDIVRLLFVVDWLAHMFQYGLDCCLVAKQKQSFVVSGG